MDGRNLDHIIPITGTDLMKKWSLDATALLLLSYEKILFPELPKDFRDDICWLLTRDSETQTNYLSRCIYDQDITDVVEVIFANHLESVSKKVTDQQEHLTATATDISNSDNTQSNTVDPDVYIHKLGVAFINDRSILIKAPGSKEQEFTCDQMGFKESERTWELLIEVLQSKDHLCHVGVYSHDRDVVKNRNYNNWLKRLSNLSRKVVSFLNKEYYASLPKGFNIFENRKGYERAGAYKPKFNIIDNRYFVGEHDINNMSDTELVNKIKELSMLCRQERDETTRVNLLTSIGPYATKAYEKKLITRQQLQAMITLPDEISSVEDAMSHARPWNEDLYGESDKS